MRTATHQKQLDALTSPARQEIVDALQANGASTVSEIAAQLGRPADALYYHVRQLVAVGLIEEVDRRPVGRRTEAVYGLVDPHFRIHYDLDEPKFREPLAAAVSAMLRISDRDFRAGLELPEAHGGGVDRNIWGGRRKAWLTSAEIREIRRHMDAIHDIMHAAKPSPHRQLIAVTWVMTPLNPNPRCTPDQED